MKFFFTLLLGYLSVTALLGQAARAPRTEVLANSPAEIIVRFALPDLEQRVVTTPRGPAVVVSFPGSTPLLEAGAPDLPKYALALQIPSTGAMTIEVIAEKYQDFADVDVAPSKGNLSRAVDPDTVPYTYGNAYASAAFYPARAAVLADPFVLRQVRGQAVWFQPVQYDPAGRVLRVYSELTVRVRPSGEAGRNELRTVPAASTAFDELAMRAFANYRPTVGERSSSSGAMERMLVVTPETYRPVLEPLLAWKRQLGIHTTVVTTEEIGSTSATAVYNYVQTVFQGEGLTYLLLVGDEQAIASKMVDGLSCDHCFSYLAGDDHVPDVLIGRLNAADAAQLAIMVNRQLDYEKDPTVTADENWMATGIAMASNEGPGDDDQMDFEHGNEWKGKHLADGYEKYYEFYDGNQSGLSPTPGEETADAPGSPATSSVVDVLNNRGVGLVNYTGHGWEQGLVTANFTNAAVNQLDNLHRYPIVIVVGCSAGDFTLNNGQACLGDAFQRAGNAATGEPYGAISSYMSSVLQSWSPPMEGQDGMNQYLVDADGVTLHPTIGGMGAFGMTAMVAAYEDAGSEMVDFWNHFGEPSTVPRTRLPEPLAATLPAGVYVGSTNLVVESPVEGALVGLYWQGQTLAAARIENGLAVLDFPPLTTVGDLTITVSQFNYRGLQTTVPVFVNEGAFVINQLIKIDDSAGDNDGKPDYGETIVVDLELANLGLENATDISATLSTGATEVALTDGAESYTDLAPGAAALKPAAFSFTVADDAANGTPLLFNLHLAYNGGQTYDLPIALTIQAPKLELTSWVIDDAASGNGNGRLESGETAVVRVSNANTGQSVSATATGKLTTSSPWLTVGPAVDLGALAVQGGPAEAIFPVTVSSQAPTAAAATFDYELSAGAYQTSAVLGPVVLNPVIETFETASFNAYPWTMAGGTPWAITISQPYEGLYCSRSGVVGNNNASNLALMLHVSDAGVIGFARRVSSEADFDFLSFYIDDVLIDTWSGELPWAEVSYPIEPGLHTFRWSYKKDGLNSDGQDRAWIDDVVLPPHDIVVTTTDAPDGATLLQAAPNPGADYVRLSIAQLPAAPRAVRLYDAGGRVVQNLTAVSGERGQAWSREIDTSTLPAGAYVAEVQLATGVCRVVVIKK
jgi:hypothetical protein